MSHPSLACLIRELSTFKTLEYGNDSNSIQSSVSTIMFVNLVSTRHQINNPHPVPLPLQHS